jgi:surfeit locus 1 family protein
MRPLLRPRWLVVHLIVVAIAVTFVNLGFWQLRRLAEVREDNARVTANLSVPEAPLATVLAEDGNNPDALVQRRVEVSGRYRPDDEFLLTPRSSNRQPGHHVVTPLELPNGSAVLVDRGWVPFTMDVPPVGEAAPPEGTVTVRGILSPTAEAVRFGTRGGQGDRLTFLSTVDVDRIQPQISVPLLPVSVLLQEQDPAPSGLPVPGTPPAPSEGSHQSYAWQWFSFATILLGGYPLLLRRSARASTTTAEAEPT